MDLIYYLIQLDSIGITIKIVLSDSAKLDESWRSELKTLAAYGLEIEK